MVWPAVTPEPQYAATGASARTPRASKRARSASGDRKRPSSSVFSVSGAFTAPGTWPATGSIGSCSPRNRSAARTSSSTPWRGDRGAPSAVDDRELPGAPPVAGLGVPGLGRDRASGGRPRREPTVEHQHVVVAVVAEQPPEPGGRGGRARRRTRPRSSRARCRPVVRRPRTARVGQRVPPPLPGARRGRRRRRRSRTGDVPRVVLLASGSARSVASRVSTTTASSRRSSRRRPAARGGAVRTRTAAARGRGRPRAPERR